MFGRRKKIRKKEGTDRQESKQGRKRERGKGKEKGERRKKSAGKSRVPRTALILH